MLLTGYSILVIEFFWALLWVVAGLLFQLQADDVHRNAFLGTALHFFHPGLLYAILIRLKLKRTKISADSARMTFIVYFGILVVDLYSMLEVFLHAINSLDKHLAVLFGIVATASVVLDLVSIVWFLITYNERRVKFINGAGAAEPLSDFGSRSAWGR